MSRDPLSLKKGRARVIHVKYNRVSELTASEVSSVGALLIGSGTDASIRSTGGKVLFLRPVTLSGVGKVASLSGLRASSKTLALNYANMTNATAEGSGILVDATSIRSLVFQNGAWTLREGDLKLKKKVSDGTYASHRFSITSTGNLLLGSKKGTDAENPVAYYHFGIASPVRTVVSQPASLGSSAQAAQVDFFSSGPVDWNVSFNYPIVDFSTDLLEGVQVSSYGPVSTSDNRVFRFLVTPLGSSVFSVSVPDETFHDSQGNLAPLKIGYQVINDPFPPVVQVNSGVSSSLSHVIPWTVTFSKPVANFTTALLPKTYNVAGFGTAVSANSVTFRFNVTAASTGDVRVLVPGGIFKDAANNFAAENLSAGFGAVVTSPAPLLSATSNPSPYTNVSPIPWTIAFDEYMSNVSNATLESLVTTPNVTSVTLVSSSAGNKFFSLNVHVDAPGEVRVDIPPDVFQNSGGTLSSILLEGSTAYYDASPLTATTTSPIATSNVSPVPWTVSFSRKVESLPTAALQLTGCTFGSINTADGITYHLYLLPSASPSTVSCSLLANYVRDLYGNYLPETLATSSVAFYAGGPRILRLGARLDGALYSQTSPIPWELVLDKEINVAAMPDATIFSQFTGTNVASFANLRRPDSNYKKFYFDVFPLASNIPNTGRVVNVSISADKLFDGFGNGVAATAGESVTYDPTPPIATISFERLYSKVPTTTWTVSFDKPVSSFSTAALSAAMNVSQFGAVTASGNSYSFPVTAAAEGHYRIELLPSTVADYAGNYAAGVLSAQAYYDHTPPQPLTNTYDVSEYPTGRTNTSSNIPWRVEFSEEVVDFTTDLLELSQGIASVTCSNSTGKIFNLTLTLAAGFSHGDVYINIPANAFTDRSGNLNSSPLPSPVLEFERRPLLSSSMAGPSVPSNTNAPLIQWVVAFTRSINNFGAAMASGLSLTGCTVNGHVASSDSRVFTLDLAPTSSRTSVSVAVVAGYFYDLYGNPAEASDAPVAIEYYGASPTCTYLGPKTLRAYTNLSLIEWKIVFDLPVVGTGLLGALETTGVQELQNLQTTDNKAFFFDVVPETVGIPSAGITVRVSLPSDAVSDAGGNYAAAVTGSSTLFDNVPPVATITCLESTTTQNYPQTLWRISFDSDVTSFNLNYLSKEHNVKSFESLSMISMSQFEFKVNADKTGSVNVALLPGVVPDRSGNYVSAAIGTAITYDPVDPLVMTLEPSLTSPANQSPIPWTLTFDKKITNFSTSALSQTNVSSITNSQASPDSKSFTFDVHPLAQGAVTIAVPENTFMDETDSYASAATSSILYDSVPPVATLAPDSAISNSASMTWTLSFSEPVIDFSASDLTFTNATSTQLTKVSSTLYSISTTAASQGDVVVTIPSNGVLDAAGNAVAPKSAHYTFDPVAPGVVRLGPTLDGALYTNSSPIPWELVLDSDIAVSAMSDSSFFSLLTGTNVASFQNLSRPDLDYKKFHFEVVPDASGIPNTGRSINVALQASKLYDVFGNSVAVTPGESVTYDPTPPVATISYTSEYSSLPTTTWTVSFDKPVVSFTADCLSAALNVSQFGTITASGNSYSIPVTAAAEGFYRIELLSSTVADHAGNFAAGVLSQQAYYDHTPPQPLVNTYDTQLYPTGRTNTSSGILWHLEFREHVVDFNTATLEKSSGIASIDSSATSGTSFDLTVNLASNFTNGDVNVTIPANSFSDRSGNKNALPLASPTLSYESRPPTSSSEAGTGVSANTNLNPIPWVITFSRSISDFESTFATGLSLSGCSVSGFTASSVDSVYTLNLVPTSTRSSVSVSVLDNKFHDLYGNAATASSTPSAIEYYGQAPACTYLGPATLAEYTNSTLIGWRIVFDLPVVTTALLTSLSTLGVSELKNMQTSDSKTITFDVVPITVSIPSSGLSVQVSLPSNAVSDAGGNYAASYTGNSIVFENVSPILTLENPTNGNATAGYYNGAISATLTASEPVKDVTFTVTNCSITGLSGSGTSYTYTVTPTAEGVFSYDANAYDLSGNTGSRSSGTLNYSATTLTVNNIQGPGSYYENTTGLSPLYTVVFSKAVTLNNTNIYNSPGTTLSGLSASSDAKTWTFNVTAATADTNFDVYILAGLSDPYGNLLGSDSTVTTTKWLKPLEMTDVVVNKYVSAPPFSQVGVTITATIENFSGTYAAWVHGLSVDTTNYSRQQQVGAVLNWTGSGNSFSATITTAFTDANMTTSSNTLRNARYWILAQVQDSTTRVCTKKIRVRMPAYYTYVSAAAQSVTIDTAGTVEVSMWGACGGGTANGRTQATGAAGYTTCTFPAVVNDRLALYAPKAGASGAVRVGGGGGGAAGLKFGDASTGVIYAVAGGSGGMGGRTASPQSGGAGGGATGELNSITDPVTGQIWYSNIAFPGTQSSGGAGGAANLQAFGKGASGAYLQGGNGLGVSGGLNSTTDFGWGIARGGFGGIGNASFLPSGGGGGGYYGGGGGTAEGASYGFGGGGGSGYIRPGVVGSTGDFRNADKLYTSTWTYGSAINQDGVIAVLQPL